MVRSGGFARWGRLGAHARRRGARRPSRAARAVRLKGRGSTCAAHWEHKSTMLACRGTSLGPFHIHEIHSTPNTAETASDTRCQPLEWN